MPGSYESVRPMRPMSNGPDGEAGVPLSRAAGGTLIAVAAGIIVGALVALCLKLLT